MKWLFVLLAITSLATPASTQTAYTYGDLMTGEEVRVEEGNDLLAVALGRLTSTFTKVPEIDLERLRSAQSGALEMVAMAAQIAGDGITCDIIVTHLLQEQGLGFVTSAQQAQIYCMAWGMAVLE